MESPIHTRQMASSLTAVPTTALGYYFIEEKQLKALIVANDGIGISFQRLADSPDEKNHYALVITINEKSHPRRFVLCTTPGRDIRRFRDLDYGRRFIQRLKPDLERFHTVIDPTLQDHPTGELTL
ncbi:MAG TPA: hypothetical protein PK031_03340 [Pseudomonadales bacterium]|nr:hypothetical protein [Pseudomonadales bacterium]